MKQDSRLKPIVAAVILMISVLNTSWAVQRSFLMGTTIFHDFFQLSPEYLGDKDMLSVHIDNYFGIPWSAFQNGTPLPATWVSRWSAIHNDAQASNKVLYLSIGFFSGTRKTLTDNVDANGVVTSDWAPKDADGCYPFATDANAQNYKNAYINYAKWAIQQINPSYVSPSIELSVALEHCPSEKTALIQWYSDVHQALKAAYPELVVFPTFQAENMYGLSDPGAQCGSPLTDASLAACFQKRLDEAVSIPADRIAFSFYPANWNYPPTAPNTYTPTPPYEDMFSRVQRTTTRKIWIAETGWGAAPIYDTYQHASPSSVCGTVIVPTPIINGEANMAHHLSNLLAQAQSKQFEAVVWWSNHDLLDATVASSCPCAGNNSTCMNAEQLYQAGGGGAAGNFLEFEYRIFANMGLRYFDGSPRASLYSIWTSYLSETLSISTPVAGGFQQQTLEAVQIFPNPLRPSLGRMSMNFSQLPAATRIRIYTLTGEKVQDLVADASGHAVWDGTNASGQKAASGVYFVLIQYGNDKKTYKVAVQR